MISKVKASTGAFYYLREINKNNMKSLYEYLEEAFTAYDERKHVVGVDFSRLSNEGDNNILNDIVSQCPHLISPEEEEFGYQKLTIEFDKNLLTFVTPNIFTNDSMGAPTTLTFKYKVKGDIVKDYIARNKEFTGDDFKEQQRPKFITRIDADESTQYCDELRKLMAIVMNRQPEPIW